MGGWRPLRGLLVGLSLSAAAGGAASPVLAEEAPFDFRRLLDETRRINQRDYEAWRTYRFRRQVLREKLDKAQEAASTVRLEFQVTPAGDGFDELLLEIDGRAPRVSEIAEHRKAARFSRHYHAFQADEDADPSEGFSLQTLLDLPAYGYRGLDRVAGVDCYRLDFEPLLGRHARSIPERFAEVMAGSLWITTSREPHLARLVAETVRPVPVALGFIRVISLRVEASARPVSARDWLPTGFGLQSHVRIVGKSLRRRNTIVYLDYERVAPGSAAEP